MGISFQSKFIEILLTGFEKGYFKFAHQIWQTGPKKATSSIKCSKRRRRYKSDIGAHSPHFTALPAAPRDAVSIRMDCTQPMMAADNEDSNSSITSADRWADKCVGVLQPVAGLENFTEELRVMGGENKIGRVRERCDITIENKVRPLVAMSTSK